jgi:hypothetical protein
MDILCGDPGQYQETAKAGQSNVFCSMFGEVDIYFDTRTQMFG